MATGQGMTVTRVEPGRDDFERIPTGELDPRLGMPHAPESAALKTTGEKDWKIEDLTAEWVVKRLMRESTDYGSRTRQTSRVAALRTLAEILGVVDEGMPNKGGEALRKASELSKEERLALIREKVKKLGMKVEANG